MEKHIKVRYGWKTKYFKNCCIQLKNKLKLSGGDVENTVRKINPKLYSGLIKHDKTYPNNKWIPYLFPKHVYGIGESKLSLMNTLKQIDVWN